MPSDDGLTIPNHVALSEEARAELYLLALRIHAENGTRHGATALFWNLLYVIQDHLKTEEPR